MVVEMPLTTAQIVAPVRKAGLKDFTARKLERWANLGAIPHPKRRGKGRGRGWEFLWPDQALVCALLIADAFAWQKGRRFEDAVLWAWLRGGPIPLPVVRRYLARAYAQSHGWLERHLKGERRDEEDEPLDLVDRLARVFARKHETLRAEGVPMKTRVPVMREAVAHLMGLRWSEDKSETAKSYRQAWEAIFGRLGIPWATTTAEARRQQAFFEYRRLERLARNATDDELLAARNAFAQGFYQTAEAIERVSAGQRLPASQRSEAEATYRNYSILFQMDPAWVTALFLYNAVNRQKRGRAKGAHDSPASERDSTRTESRIGIAPREEDGR